MPDRPTLAFADDRSPGAQQARSWIRLRNWTGWAGCTLAIRPDPGALADDPAPLTACGFAETTTGQFVGDPRDVLAARNEDALLVVGAGGQPAIRSPTSARSPSTCCMQPASRS
jgi:hypothetical protein